MKTSNLLISLLLIITFLYSCNYLKKGNKQTENQVSNEIKIDTLTIISKGTAITQKIQEVLSEKLKKAVTDSGVAYALRYCNLNAYPLTDSISDLYKASVKRVSHKARNPANMAHENESGIINSYLDAEDKLLNPVVNITENHITYFAPIKISSPLCLKCHGFPDVDINLSDLQVINSLYPDDEATGFKLNDLRGIWRVDFKMEL